MVKKQALLSPPTSSTLCQCQFSVRVGQWAMLIKTCALVLSSEPVPCLNQDIIISSANIYRLPVAGNHYGTPKPSPDSPAKTDTVIPGAHPSSEVIHTDFIHLVILKNMAFVGTLMNLIPMFQYFPRARDGETVRTLRQWLQSTTIQQSTTTQSLPTVGGSTWNVAWRQTWCWVDVLVKRCWVDVLLVKSAATRHVAIWAPLLTSNPAGPLIRSWRWKPSQTLTRPYLLN